MISPNRECSSFPIKIKIDKADVGLENVDNTSDLDKPISNAVRDYIDNVNSAIKKAVTVGTTQNITGAKTFAGETTITGPLGVSGDTALTGKVTVEKELNVDSNGTAEINGKLTASNTGNAIKVANHDSVLTSNDVLSAKDINEVNGSGNNLLHRSGDESIYGLKTFEGNVIIQGFILSKTNDSATPSTNKNFQIEVDSTDGFTHYVAFASNSDGSRSINMVMGNGKSVEGYFNLTKNADGTLAIYTNFPKPSNW